jgi:hypothetical protein
MKFTWLAKHKLVAGLIAIGVLGGAGGAVAATQSSSSNRHAYLNDVAKRLGVSPSALTGALQGAAIDRIEAARAAGRLTQSQADALKQRVREGRPPLFRSAGFGRARLHAGVGRPGVAGAASRYLGISPEALLHERQSGKSLAKIAESTPGKSVAGLKAAILRQAKKRLDAGVSRGRITSKQESQLLASLPTRIQALLERSGPGLGLGPNALPRRPGGPPARDQNGAGAPAPGGPSSY